MRIVIAPNSFKGTLTAAQACAAIARGVRAALPDADIVEAPLADGGEGTVDAIVAATASRRRTVRVTGPLGEPVDATFGLLDDGRRAVIEMAAASGILLVPPERRDALRATTFGTGELIRAALDAGARELLVGIGGSATSDGGAGMAQALGIHFLDREGTPLPAGLGGGALLAIDRIDVAGRDPRIAGAAIDVLCDVTNPLTGPNGSAAVYAPQKGASPAEVTLLDRNLDHLAALIARDLGSDVRSLPGAGAAGGLGAGLVAFLGGRLRSGAQAVINFIRLEERCAGADAILTGEGRFDQQSLYGKSLSAIAALGARCHVPVLVIAGGIDLPASAWQPHVAAVAASGAEHPDAATAVARATASLLARWLDPRG